MKRALFVFLLLLSAWFLISPRSSNSLRLKIRESVRVSWDKNGIPLVEASNLLDAYHAQGFITSRDRFFQMELVRRKMSGRLAEVFGPKALKSDLDNRKWGYQQAAEAAFKLMPPEKQNLFQAFSAGVNDFLHQNNRPWELVVLGLVPEPWKPSDTLLVVLSMYDSLNRHKESDEEVMSLLKERFSSEVIRFLVPDWGFLDAPILTDPPQLPTLTLPDAGTLTVEKKRALSLPIQSDFEYGSNAWVISGSRTQNGAPILANDPHLDLRVPNLWYRIGIQTPQQKVYGASIPGIPGVVIGRNESVAWGFTNSSIDTSDQVLVEKKSHVLTQREETILVKGEAPHLVSFTNSPWGPVISEEKENAIAIQWTALDPRQLSKISLVELNEATDSSSLLAAFSSWAGPPQNALFATKEGSIGWTIAGQLPKRKGFDGKARMVRNAHIDWDGYVSREMFPVVLNPKEGFIISANQRTVPPGAVFGSFGHYWPNPARAKRIQDLVKQKQIWNSSDVLTIQLDTLSLTHLWYRDQIKNCQLKVMSTEDEKWLSTLLELLNNWNGHADMDSSAYPVLRAFRDQVFQDLILPIAQAISRTEEEKVYKYLRRDSLVYQLLSHKPRNLLPPDFSTYCDLIQSSLIQSAQKLVPKPELLKTLTWGSLNQSMIQHPFSTILPGFLSWILNFPQKPMSGDSLVPNVMTPTNGVSMRLIIDWSDPTRSLFAQPGGQSGHFYSPNYTDSFTPWLNGKSLSFEMEPITATEIFIPRTDSDTRN